MVDVQTKIDKRKSEGFDTAYFTVESVKERVQVTNYLSKMGYEFKTRELLRKKPQEAFKIRVQIPYDELEEDYL